MNRVAQRILKKGILVSFDRGIQKELERDILDTIGRILVDPGTTIYGGL